MPAREKKLTSRKDFPPKLPAEKTFYCFKCKKPGVAVKPGKKEKYFCESCGKANSRCLIFDPKMRYEFNKKGELAHFGGGMFILNKQNKIFLFLRKKYPYLYTTPGGHMTFGESPKKCAVREVREETGLDIKSCRLIYKGVIRNDSCPGGADIHYWYLYKTNDYKGRIKLDAEGAKWKWFSMDEIDLAKVTYPVRYFLTNKKIKSKILF